MHAEVFVDESLLKRYKGDFVLAYVDTESSNRIQLPNGERTTEMQFTVRSRILGTPTFIYFSPQQQPLFKRSGFQTIEQMALTPSMSAVDTTSRRIYSSSSTTSELAFSYFWFSSAWHCRWPVRIAGNFLNAWRVPANAGEGVFHHLDGAGRKHIAVSGDAVAITWEDNSNGVPQVYVAMLETEADGFETAVQVSRGKEAYEPAITALDQGRFLVVWEQDAEVHAVAIEIDGLVSRGKLSAKTSGHASVDSYAGRAVISWRQQAGAGWYSIGGVRCE